MKDLRNLNKQNIVLYYFGQWVRHYFRCTVFSASITSSSWTLHLV